MHLKLDPDISTSRTTLAALRRDAESRLSGRSSALPEAKA
jgi:hypothetical protein